MALPDHEVHVWYLPLNQVAPRDLERCCERLLSPDERERGARFAFERDRRQFLVGRSLLRIVLSKYATVPANLWRFCVNKYGKPQIESPVATPDLHFSVTHTPILAAVAVSAGLRIGVDAECVSRSTEWRAIAQRYFAPEEWRDLMSLPGDEQQAGFFRLWTLKEALVKALGTGLSTPLDAFRFEFSAGQPPQVHFSCGMENSPKEWMFWLFSTLPAQQVAVAVEHPFGHKPELVVNLADLRFTA